MRQEEIIKAEKKKRLLPVLYISQLMGLAFGLPAKDLGLNSHLVDPLPLLRERGLL